MKLKKICRAVDLNLHFLLLIGFILCHNVDVVVVGIAALEYEPLKTEKQMFV